ADGGFKEEMREINPSIGIEYWYQQRFAGRVGYFYEHPTKGNRQYFTAGIGIKYNIFQLDFAYLVPTNSSVSSLRSPLERTLRFTLKFNFGEATANS
ncbi:MAG: PorV/PorQ family protein, partial [Bacteroidota bacterium]|nr:PorV/PorQ family protein [Bacteroidota bacterium]